MKREGRQHGMVRTHCIPTSTAALILPRKVNSLTGASPVAGVFVRVPSKPTNHSKFTGKCRRPRCLSCHSLPCSKSKDKSKGSSKIKSLHDDLGCGLKVVLDELHDYTHLGKYRGEAEEDDEKEEVEYDHENVCCNEVRDDGDLGFCDVSFSSETSDGDEFEGWFLVG